MASRVACVVFVLGCLTVNQLAAADEKFVLIREVKDGELLYRSMSITDYAVAKKLTPTLRKLPGTFPSERKADDAGRSDADRVGWYDCWRCDGEGTVVQLPRSKIGKYRCPACFGKKRLRSTGYAIVQVISSTKQWTLRFVRQDQLKFLNPDECRTGPRLSFRVKMIRRYPIGMYHAAQKDLEARTKKVEKMKGFVKTLPLLLGYLQAEWPETFYASQK